MPWHIEKREDKWCVIKDDDGENEGCHETEEGAERQRRALYASENRREKEIAPVEIRSAVVSGVNFAERKIELVAVPWNEEAVVEYRSELWLESFERGAFDGLEKMASKVKANRDHDKTRLVGKALSFSDQEQGLISIIKVSPTPLGDETLALANDDVLAASVGFGVRGSDQTLDRVERRRRIRRAFMDHLAFVPDQAYEGARVLSVREDGTDDAARLPKLETPRLDEVLAWKASRPRRGE